MYSCHVGEITIAYEGPFRPVFFTFFDLPKSVEIAPYGTTFYPIIHGFGPFLKVKKKIKKKRSERSLIYLYTTNNPFLCHYNHLANWKETVMSVQRERIYLIYPYEPACVPVCNDN